MAFKTAKEITQAVVKLAGLVSGTGVQTYTEPQILQSIQLQFDMLFIKRYWEWLTDWHTVVLSGAGGLIASNINSFCSDFVDIDQIYINGTSRRVVKPIDREHFRASGSNPMYYTPLMWTDALAATKLIKFWPITATGSVDIRCRTKPAVFIPTDTVPFSDVVITNAATWHLLDNDGINPTAASKAQTLFEVSYRDLIAAMGDDVIGRGSDTYAPITIRTL